jgi:hypothetical protein
MPVSTNEFRPGLTTGFSQTTNLDAGTYSVTQIAEGLSIPKYDYIALTYVAAGNGVGEIETVTYKTGGVSGITVGELTLGYDASNRLSTVTRTA